MLGWGCYFRVQQMLISIILYLVLFFIEKHRSSVCVLYVEPLARLKNLESWAFWMWIQEFWSRVVCIDLLLKVCINLYNEKVYCVHSSICTSFKFNTLVFMPLYASFKSIHPTNICINCMETKVKPFKLWPIRDLVLALTNGWHPF